jgi:tripartite-type tricarboxylate transporter receptor subunit TctC
MTVLFQLGTKRALLGNAGERPRSVAHRAARRLRRHAFSGVAGLAFAASAVFTGVPAQAQDYPNRAVTIVVPYGPGGLSDAMGRLAASRLQAALGQPFVVDNRPGAAGTIGANRVAQSDPDGYTILQHTSVIAIHTVFNKKLTFNPLKDIVPVTILGKGPQVLLVAADLPVSSVAELIDHINANPGKLNYASTGIGSTPHLIAERFSRGYNLDVAHVPFADSGSANLALMAGQVQIMFDSISALEIIRSGKVKAIAVTSETRWPGLTDVPTMQELGLPEMTLGLWTALFVPAGTPQGIVDRIASVIGEAATTDEFKTVAERAGMLAIGSTPAEAAETFAADVQTWRKLADSGFVLQE